MKTVFIGTTEFGIPAAEELLKNFGLALVVTQPDRPAGRRQELASPPVKLWAQKNNVRFLQTEKITELEQTLRQVNPDIVIVAAFGQILPPDILAIPRKGCLNLHGSILPALRGASPIQTSLASGETETGVTLILMDEKMDHGPIIAAKPVAIDDGDDFTKLHHKLSLASAQLLKESLPKYLNGEVTPLPQDEARATYTKTLTRADGRIVWTTKASDIINQIRAYNPEPGTWTMLDGKTIKIISAEKLIDSKIELPGKIYRHDSDLAVKTADYSIIITKLVPEGKPAMKGSDYLNGLKQLETKILV